MRADAPPFVPRSTADNHPPADDPPHLPPPRHREGLRTANGGSAEPEARRRWNGLARRAKGGREARPPPYRRGGGDRSDGGELPTVSRRSRRRRRERRRGRAGVADEGAIEGDASAPRDAREDWVVSESAEFSAPVVHSAQNNPPHLPQNRTAQNEAQLSSHPRTFPTHQPGAKEPSPTTKPSRLIKARPNNGTMAIQTEEIDDWIATCAIYDTASDRSERPLEDGRGGGYLCYMDVPVRVRDTALIRRLTDGDPDGGIDPEFGFNVCDPDDAPVVRLTFRYKDPDSGPEGVGIELVRYRRPWPAGSEAAWVGWLTREASRVLRETEISYAVCELVEYEALAFFGPVISDEVKGFSAIVCLDRALGLDETCSLPVLVDGSPEYDSLEGFAGHTIASRWKEWVDVECPICFDRLPLAESVELDCGHRFCSECFSTYAKTKVEEIHRYRVNPFRCPAQSCRRDLKIVACVKRFLSESEMDEVRQWHRNLKYPLSSLLRVCPRKRCGERAMRREADGSSIVFCDSCSRTWCENCLQKNDGDHECDPILVVQVCQRYLAASNKIKTKCEERWHWIKEYAPVRMDIWSLDEGASQWVKEHASRCPRCNMAIERTEGCFHMECTQCATHFCYECGTELVPPYYGTHHCWERKQLTEVNFDFDV